MKRRKMSRLATLLVGAVATLALLAACGGGNTPAPSTSEPAVAAQPAAPAAPAMEEKPYFEGKTIRLIANHPPGGGADLNARTVARNLGRLVPGNPRIVVLNKVGAASLVGAHFVYNAKPDGLTLGVFTGVNPGRQLMQPGVRYDLMKFRPIAGLQRRTVTWEATQDVPYERLQDAIGKGSDPNAKRFTVAAEQICSENNLRLRALTEWLDLPLDIKLGLPGSRVRAMQQIDQGVIDSVHSAFWYTVPRDRPGWYEDKFIRPLAMVSLTDTDFPPNAAISMPEGVDYIYNILPEQSMKDLYVKFAPDLGPMYRVFLAPPGTPDHVLKILRDAAWEMVHDEKFLADYKKILAGDSVSPTTGEDMEKLYEFTLGDMVSLIPELEKFLPECRFNTDFG